MFEKEIEFIYKYNLNKIKHLGSFITYEQLLNTNIHPALLQYLSAEIDFLIYEDRQKLLKDSLFDYSGNKITELFSSIGEEIKRTKKFSYEYLTKLLLHASSFNANFLIRPKWSLMQFIFENENESTKQITEVKQILNYLYYYPYLKRLLINFFDKKRMISISASELEDLLDKIDKINYESNFDKVLDSAFSSIAEFIYAGEIKNRKISNQFVELFLVDKGLEKFQIPLAQKFSGGIQNKFDISEFKTAILNFNNDENLSNYNIEKSSDELSDDYDEEVELVDERNSFQEIDNAKMEVEDNDLIHLETKGNEDLELPELDEDRRVDEKNIDEIYELVTEEEKLDSFVEEEYSTLSRVEIDENINPFEEGIENATSSVETINSDEQKDDETYNEKFVQLGSAIKFNANDLVSKTNNEPVHESEEEGWATESSSNADDNYKTQENDIDVNIDSETVSEKPNSEVMDEIKSILNDNDDLPLKIENDESAFGDEEAEPMLFNEEELEGFSSDQKEADEEHNESVTASILTTEENFKTINISLLLENKKISKIIEVVFDYDMEDFASAIDDISEAKSETEAHKVIDEIAKRAYIDSSVKEIKMFKNIISDFFN
ncbi:MAG: hypothetical protein KKF62_15470 [Bacteroidetes bacterium]|nr:hypothetical protein [Bacteroidota bacterium]MBU1114704.1 hypothetical protein [Bacteroidota bacterium]MBU1798906.1 hypothetical protein [Bacteroidota bacterium]